MTADNTTSSDYGKIVALLLEVGLLTEKQVQYALRVRSKIKSQKPLLDIIRAYLTRKTELEKEDYLMIMVRRADKTTNAMGIGRRGVEPGVLAATPEADYFGLSEIALAELEIKLEDSKVFA